MFYIYFNRHLYQHCQVLFAYYTFDCYRDVKNWYNWVNMDEPELGDMFRAMEDTMNYARAAGEKVNG